MGAISNLPKVPSNRANLVIKNPQENPANLYDYIRTNLIESRPVAVFREEDSGDSSPQAEFMKRLLASPEGKAIEARLRDRFKQRTGLEQFEEEQMLRNMQAAILSGRPSLEL